MIHIYRAETKSPPPPGPLLEDRRTHEQRMQIYQDNLEAVKLAYKMRLLDEHTARPLMAVYAALCNVRI